VTASFSKSLPQEVESKLETIKNRYPDKRSAVMPALYLAQEQYGWLTKEAIEWVSNRLEMPPTHVDEVASFYTMYYKKPVGKYHVQVCRTLSCMICGAVALTKHLKTRFGLRSGEISADGMWSYEEVECLGSCGTAPMVQINDVFFENLNPEKLDAVLNRIEKEQPALRFSTTTEELGTGMSDCSRSQVTWGE